MDLRAKLANEVGAPPPGATSERTITDDDVAVLPSTARRYFRFMEVVGRPPDRSFRLALRGRFRRRRDERWMACDAFQYNTRAPISRSFYMRLRLGGVVPVLGRDTYADGHGRMLIRPLDLFTVADARGDELDTGELVTWLDDAVLIAPSMLLLTPSVRFAAVDGDSFEVALHDGGHTVTARVVVDERGAPLDFVTSDRFTTDPRDGGRWVRARWSTPVDGWQRVGGRPLFTRGCAVWRFDDGELEYADLTPVAASLAFNVAPGG